MLSEYEVAADGLVVIYLMDDMGKDLGHAHFSSDDGFHELGPPYNLMSISTPEGRSNFLNASTVSFCGLVM